MQALRQGPVPKHLAFVMDGNRRYAKEHNISIPRGHVLGFEAMEKVRHVILLCFKKCISADRVIEFGTLLYVQYSCCNGLRIQY